MAASYYQIDNENFGLHFFNGIDAAKIFAELEKAQAVIQREEM